MIHLNYHAEKMITICIVDDFSHSDTERIALILEATYDDDYDKEIVFQVESDLTQYEMKLLGSFCGHLPYASQIDLKYPVLEWEQS